MKEEILDIAQKLKDELIDIKQAEELLLQLFELKYSETTGINTMITVNNIHFSCNCGCNVFQRLLHKSNTFRCNACKELYTGE